MAQPPIPDRGTGQGDAHVPTIEFAQCHLTDEETGIAQDPHWGAGQLQILRQSRQGCPTGLSSLSKEKQESNFKPGAYIIHI